MGPPSGRLPSSLLGWRFEVLAVILHMVYDRYIKIRAYGKSPWFGLDSRLLCVLHRRSQAWADVRIRGLGLLGIRPLDTPQEGPLGGHPSLGARLILRSILGRIQKWLARKLSSLSGIMGLKSLQRTKLHYLEPGSVF